MLFALILAAPAAPAQDGTFFEENVRPALIANCAACHGASRISALRVDSREALLRGGTRGPAIVPGDPDRSLLLAVIEHRDSKLKMPPSGKLPDSQIAVIRRWIQQGAPWPAATPASSGARKPLWSLAPIRKPLSRSLDDMAGANPAPEPSPRALLLRISFDLTGLPPTYEEVRQNEPYEQAVERLLASPHFGEKWARHWLDVARYGEDDVRGLGQAEYPNAWRYRDWVIQAYNDDLPYDQFIKLQIAADLLPRPSKDDRAALGLFGLGPWYYSNAPPPEARADERHDRVDVLTRGFLGLTVGCARCHDHKFDPISTREYYALAQVFARTQYTEYPLVPESQVQSWDQAKQRIDGLEKQIKSFLSDQGRQLSEILARETARYLTAIRDAEAKPNWRKIARKNGLDEETLRRWHTYLSKPRHEHAFLADWKKGPARIGELALSVLAEKKDVDDDNEAAVAPTRPKKGAAKTRLPNGFETYDEFCPGCNVVARSMERDRYMFWSDLFKPAEKKGGGVLYYGSGEIERFLRGHWRNHLDGLRRELAAAKKALGDQYPYLHAIGDRAELKELRIHLRGDPYNLGDAAPRRFLEICGSQPLDSGSGRKQLAEAIATHPLAVRVAVNRIWGNLTGEYLVSTPSNFGTLGSMPSNAALLEELAARFAVNGYSTKHLIREIALSRAYRSGTKRRRLNAEAVRDAMLHAAGLLDRTIGGKSVDLARDRTRRSIYGKVSRFRLDDSLVLFDFPNPGITAEKRGVTHVPLQQLYFLNSPFVANAAAALARNRDVAQIYRRIFARDPAGEEITVAREYVAGQGDLESFAQTLLSSNEFYFVD